MVDFLLDTDGDLALSGNDVVFGKSNQQHKELLLMTAKGQWKENLLVGVDAFMYLEGENANGLLNETRVQFIKDGMVGNAFQFDNTGKMLTNADYPN